MIVLQFVDIATLLGLEKPNESDYPQLTLIEGSVVSAIQNHTGRIISYGPQIEEFDYSVSDLALKALPVESVTDILSPNITWVSNLNYTISFYGVKLFQNEKPGNRVSVEYIGGYQTIPGDLYRAVLMQTAYEWQSRDHIGASSVSNEGGSIQRPELGLLKETIRLLQDYIHPLKNIH